MKGMQSEESLVSVVTPTFNRRDLLEKAVQSIIAQTHRNLQIIIVDDGSTDGTRELVQDIPDPRITYIYQSNSGQSAARNAGIKLARGEFLAFLDSDNLWVPDRISRHVKLIEKNPDFDAVYGISAVMNSESTEFQKARNLPSGWITNELLRGNFIPFNSTLVRKSLIEKSGGFDEGLRSAEDYDFWLRASVQGRFLYSPEICTYYRKTPGSISTDLSRNFAANKRILKRFLEAHPERGRFPNRSMIWHSFYSGTSSQWSGARQHGAALRDAIKAIAWAPWAIQGYIGLARRAANSLRRPAGNR